jgi:hypothetical protein
MRARAPAPRPRPPRRVRRARRFDTTAWRVRALFIVSCLLPGPQFLLYLALWIIVPSE